MNKNLLKDGMIKGFICGVILAYGEMCQNELYYIDVEFVKNLAQGLYEATT